ncbi:unnamed protein product [Absidia cylindrospora]
MESFIFGSELDQFGNSNEPFFSLPLLILDLQQQAQSATQQQHQQQGQQQGQPRYTQEIWQDSNRYLPIECHSFMMSKSATMNVPAVASPPPLPISDSSTYDPNSTSYAAMNSSSELHFEPIADVIPANDFDTTTSMINPQLASYPGQYYVSSSSLQHTDWNPSPSSTPQQYTVEPTLMPASPPRLPSTTSPDVANIIAGINWNLPVLSHTDSSKISITVTRPRPIIDKHVLIYCLCIDREPIHPLNIATETQAPPSTLSTDIPTSGRKQKKTAHNAIEKRYRKQKKTAHNAIEKRYRNNINDRINELKNAVPALAYSKSKVKDRGMVDGDEGDMDEEYLDGVAVTTKLNKATILHKATEYIHHLKRTNNIRQRENESLQHVLAQLPGGHELLTHYQAQKREREQMIQRQLVMERQWMRQDQQLRKQQAANKRNRAPRKRHLNKTSKDFGDGPSSSTSGNHPRPSDHDGGLTNNNRIFMAVFMAIAYFSSPLTTSIGSQQVIDHNHVSRTAGEQLIISSSTPNSTDFTSKYDGTPWRLLMDRWFDLRLIVFIVCLIQLLFPYLTTYVSGHSIKIRQLHTGTKLRRPTSRTQQTVTKITPSMSPGDEKCVRMTQLLAKSISNDHHDASLTLSRKSKLLSFASFIKELTIFMTRHVLGYVICDRGALDDNHDKWEQQQQHFCRWRHAFKWVKLNECECLGGNHFLSRLGMLYHSVRMLNLVDSLQEDNLEDMMLYEYGQRLQHQLSSMRARAYATATIQMTLGIPCIFLANWTVDYLWGIAIDNANEEDTWACLTGDDGGGLSNTMAILSTNAAWMETLDVIRNQMSISTVRRSEHSLDLSLSAYAPTLIPTAMLSNLHLLNRLESDFQTLIDNMMLLHSRPTIDRQQLRSSTYVFFVHTHSLFSSSLDVDARCVANWFTCVGMTVEALWRCDLARAKEGMVALAQHVPRAMIVPGNSNKKIRQSELDGLAKQQLVHTLAGATLVLKQDMQGIKELEMGETYMQRRDLALEASHMEGRVMALVELAVMLVGLKAWISTWSSNGMMITVEKTNTQIRQMSLSLRRMVCRPALAGKLKTQQLMIDRLDRVGRYVEAFHHMLDLMDSTTIDGNKIFPGVINQDELVTHMHNVMAIIQGT